QVCVCFAGAVAPAKHTNLYYNLWSPQANPVRGYCPYSLSYLDAARLTYLPGIEYHERRADKTHNKEKRDDDSLNTLRPTHHRCAYSHLWPGRRRNTR